MLYVILHHCTIKTALSVDVELYWCNRFSLCRTHGQLKRNSQLWKSGPTWRLLNLQHLSRKNLVHF